jgi:3-deoxy-manno-octulosonate cytidylyltransferase (CMP-KDO synthetase)
VVFVTKDSFGEGVNQMYQAKKIICIIPARLSSTRFPNKILALLEGKPLVMWSYFAAKKIEMFDEVYIAVDDEVTKKMVESFGAKALFTSKECLNGTERLIEAKKNYELDADIFVNWQADEPFIHKKMIETLLQSAHESVDVWTLRKKIEQEKELHDTNVVKVVVDFLENALYFSRYCIPFDRDKTLALPKYKHIGLYAFSSSALDKISHLKPTLIEKSESLEQLRFLYYGMKIKVHESLHETLGIDLPEHLEMAKSLVSQGLLTLEV